MGVDRTVEGRIRMKLRRMRGPRGGSVRLTPAPRATYSSLLPRDFEDFGAEVAELADALGSGSSAFTGVGVQIPPSAPCNLSRASQ